MPAAEYHVTFIHVFFLMGASRHLVVQKAQKVSHQTEFHNSFYPLATAAKFWRRVKGRLFP